MTLLNMSKQWSASKLLRAFTSAFSNSTVSLHHAYASMQSWHLEVQSQQPHISAPATGISFATIPGVHSWMWCSFLDVVFNPISDDKESVFHRDPTFCCAGRRKQFLRWSEQVWCWPQGVGWTNPSLFWIQKP